METKHKKKEKKMMKTSSSSRENLIKMPIPENSRNAKQSSIGCMSGIFHFLSRHTHNNSRKRLSSVERRKKTNCIATKEKPPLHQTQKPSSVHDKTIRAIEEIKRHSGEVQRSPTLPSGIRRSSSVEPCAESPRRPTPLIVKLMGLDEVPVTSSDTNDNASDQKRRKLLNALEKCDSDLKSLKRIIDAVSEANKKRDEVMLVGKLNDDYVESEKECQSSFESDKSVEQPSPVSVLDHAISSPTSPLSKSLNVKQIELSDASTILKGQDPSFSAQFPSGKYEKTRYETTKESYQSIFHKTIPTDKLQRTMQNHRENEYQLEEYNWMKLKTDSQISEKKLERNKEMVETVSEICIKGTRELSKEFAMVAFGIERGIYSDLVDDVVKDFSAYYFQMLIPQGSCRKRLCF